MSTPTLDEFKQWSVDCAPAGRAVLMARVFAELERERVNAYILPIFQSYRFEVGPNMGRRTAGELIAKPDQIYLCEDEILVAAYFEECDKAHRAHGFTGPHGHCPALRAEHLVITAENALIDLADPLFGIKDKVHRLEDRAKYLELLIGACIKADPRPIDPRVQNEARP